MWGKTFSNPNCACVRFAQALVVEVVTDPNNPNGAFQSVLVRFKGSDTITQVMIPAARAKEGQVLWLLGDKKNPDLPSLAFTDEEWRAWTGGLVGEFVATLEPPADLAEAYRRAADLDLTEVEIAIAKEYDLTPAEAASVIAKYRHHLTLVAASPEEIAVLDPEVDQCVHAHVARNGLWQHDMMQLTGSVVFHVPCGDGQPVDPETVRRTQQLYQQLGDLIPA